jgi:hypothetical protein
MITIWNIGDRVIVTQSNLQTIRNGNRSIHAFPSQLVVDQMKDLVDNEILGTVEYRFTPGFEVNVRFDNGEIYQMKDHWISRE